MTLLSARQTNRNRDELFTSSGVIHVRPVARRLASDMHLLARKGLLAAGVLALLTSPFAVGRAGELTLAIVQAGIQANEDAPFAPANYEFLPGEYLYFTFTISGYQTEKKADAIRLHLEYVVDLEDSKGVPLTPPESGTIQDELHPQDSDWLPKRRQSFQLPSQVAAGSFNVQVTVHDAVAKTQIKKQFKFRIGGRKLLPTETLGVQNFHFYRTENDTEPLEVVAYRPGDTIWARYDIVGFKTDAKHAYKVDYALTVYRPDGTVFLSAPKAGEQSSADFYAAQFIPGVLSLTTTGDSPHAEYTIVLTVQDEIGKQTFEHKYPFRVE